MVYEGEDWLVKQVQYPNPKIPLELANTEAMECDYWYWEGYFRLNKN